MTLGNGLTESRLYDMRYFPDRITVTSLGPLLDWDYMTDKVGNPTSIADVLNPTAGRSYVYQEFQHFLRQGDGPWGGLTWTYDRIGNRLSEVRNGQPADVYHYVANPAGGHDPRLDRIVLGASGMRTFEYDAAGNEIEVASGANVIERTYDDAGRLATITRSAGDVATDLLYDGRSFLRHAAERNLAHIFSDGFETGNAACWSGAVGGAPDTRRRRFESLGRHPTRGDDASSLSRRVRRVKEAASSRSRRVRRVKDAVSSRSKRVRRASGAL